MNTRPGPTPLASPWNGVPLPIWPGFTQNICRGLTVKIIRQGSGRTADHLRTVIVGRCAGDQSRVLSQREGVVWNQILCREFVVTFMPRIRIPDTVPVGVVHFDQDAFEKAFFEKCDYDRIVVTRYHEKGGHFPSLECPETMVQDRLHFLSDRLNYKLIAVKNTLNRSVQKRSLIAYNPFLDRIQFRHRMSHSAVLGEKQPIHVLSAHLVADQH